MASETVLKTAEVTLLGVQLPHLPPDPHSSENRAFGYEPKGRRFDSCCGYHLSVAQGTEQQVSTLRVGGSNPSREAISPSSNR